MGPKDLGEILRRLPGFPDANLIVGTETSDDAAVYRLSPDLAIVQTADFITPLVDDPYDYGQIAATNAISDVYAMGGTPLLALNLVGFPVTVLPLEILAEILRGGADKAIEAGVRIVGGHSIDDREPKYGMAVTGTIHPDRVLRNCTAQVGDRLILTKPLGMGIVATAVKREECDAGLLAEAVRVMTTLNRGATRAALSVGVNACTDVTGFGLLGHLREMTAGSGVGARLYAGRVPVLDGVRTLAEAGVVPGGSMRNLDFVQPFVRFDAGLDEPARVILADAQTSGGLLLAVAPSRSAALLAALRVEATPAAAEIGEIVAGPAPTITVLP